MSQDFEGIPFDPKDIDFNIFNKSELKRLNLEEINAFGVKQNLQDFGTSFDTVFKYHCTFNDEISEVNEKISLPNNRIISSTYKFTNDSTYFINTTYLFGKTSGPYGENEIKTIDYVKNGKLRTSIHYVRKNSSDWILKSKDSLYYETNKLIKITEFWYSESNPLLYDSLLTFHKYDSIGRLVSKKLIISPTFLKSIDLNPRQYEAIAHTYNVEIIYSYGIPWFLNTKSTRSKSFMFLPEVRELNFENFYLRGDYYNDIPSNFSFQYKYTEGTIAMKYNDLKKVIFEKDSALPNKIIILTDSEIYISFFTYH